MSRASGLGSWPGVDVRTPIRHVRDLLTEPRAEGEPGIAYLPELPARGPGADMIGRTAGLLAELPVDLQPSGWRLVDRPGRDAERTAALWRQDLDELAEVFDGYVGDLKVQVVGPWTLAAELRVARGERVVGDAGARRDLVSSLAEGLRRHLDVVRRLVPGADLVVQLDEPSLPLVLTGELRTSSGFGRLRAVELEVARAGLIEVVTAAGDAPVVIHCCAPKVPLPLLREAGARAVSLDISLLTPGAWESVAATVEEGVALWAGVVPGDRPVPERHTHHDVIAPLVARWRDVGLDRALLAQVVLTPACGLAGVSPSEAVRTHRLLADAAPALDAVARGA